MRRIGSSIRVVVNEDPLRRQRRRPLLYPPSCIAIVGDSERAPVNGSISQELLARCQIRLLPQCPLIEWIPESRERRRYRIHFQYRLDQGKRRTEYSHGFDVAAE